MRRTNREFKEEIFRREQEYRTRQKKRWNRALNALLCLTLIVCGCVLTLPFLEGMGAGAGAAPGMMAENGSMADAMESPAAVEDKLEYGMAGGTDEVRDVCPAVMIDGVLYFDTGYSNDEPRKCGTPDGEITSRVEVGSIPRSDDQSNFGIGYGYQYGVREGTVEIYMSGKWCIFATEEVKNEMN